MRKSMANLPDGKTLHFARVTGRTNLTKMNERAGEPGKGECDDVRPFHEGCGGSARTGSLRRLLGDSKGVAAVEFA